MSPFSFSASNAQGQKFSLPAPASLTLSFDEDSPAHSLSVRFPLPEPLPPLHTCDLSLNGSLFLTVLLDQQSFSCSPDGSWLTLSGRSRAALLLDNDAPPATYINPSLKQLFETHAKPFGFTDVQGNLGPFRGNLVVRKGMSHWQVLEEFAAFFLGTTLRAGLGRSLDASGQKSSNHVLFSNRGGIPYSSISQNLQFQKQLSHLYLQPSLGAPYSCALTNQDAINLGVLRSRYLSLAPFLAKRSMRASKRNAAEFTLYSSEPLFSRLALGDFAAIDDPGFGSVDGLSVAKISFSLKQNASFSCVTLRPVLAP